MTRTGREFSRPVAKGRLGAKNEDIGPRAILLSQLCWSQMGQSPAQWPGLCHCDLPPIVVPAQCQQESGLKDWLISFVDGPSREVGCTSWAYGEMRSATIVGISNFLGCGGVSVARFCHAHDLEPQHGENLPVNTDGVAPEGETGCGMARVTDELSMAVIRVGTWTRDDDGIGQRRCARG